MEEIILKEREVKENIVGIINSSGLPALLLKNIIKELYGQLESIEQKQYEEALKIREDKEKNNKTKGDK